MLAKTNAQDSLWIILFSIIPDIVLMPSYIILGKENKRFLWIAKNEDWAEISKNHPVLSQLYDITHSLLFAIIIYPVFVIFGLPILAFVSYLLHLAVDIFSHKQEWAIKIFYPFRFKINGFSDAWAWPVYFMAISWLILLATAFLIR